MENYEKIMLEKGQEKIDYLKICEYYTNIIYTIYRTLEKEYPSTGQYSEEYLDAYSYFQKAEWRLADINQLKNYINEPDFKYFAIENLSDARNRIESYLNNNSKIKFADKIKDYTEYDIILEMKKDLENEPEYNASFSKYKKISYQDSEIKHIKLYIDNIKNYTNLLKRELSNGRIKYIETENLLETVKLLEKIEKDLTIKEAMNTNGR